VLKRAIELFGEEAVGAYVISMTHDLSDIIEVMVFQHLVGVSLDIAPLFETLGDLEAAPGILNQMFDCEPYRSHLRARHDHQQIMLGYSDSNKDCGYLTANWALFQAQETISAVCKEAGLGLTLFHGRGGSIARGGGPAAKAILAQPCGCYDAKIRVTEQGEVLSTRYHDPDLAFRIIEQMAYGVLLGAEAAQKEAQVPEAWRAAMTEMSKLAYQAYDRARAQGPRVHRVLALGHADRGDQRAQARLPAHLPQGDQIGRGPPRHSVGLFLDAEPVCFPRLVRTRQRAGTIRRQKDAALLRAMYKEWMFFKATIDNAQLTLLKADMRSPPITPCSCRTKDPRPDLRHDRRRNSRALNRPFSPSRARKRCSNASRSWPNRCSLRNPYIDPLNYIQVEMIRRLREAGRQTGREAAEIRAVIELTINGVSGGLKNTG
jgi:phosphoenolpyruvate carboxylase